LPSSHHLRRAGSDGAAELKKLVAYSSVSHLGFVVLGIFAFHKISMQGAFTRCWRTVSPRAALLACGHALRPRHTFESASTAPGHAMPKLAAFFYLSHLSSLGLPMLNGFVVNSWSCSARTSGTGNGFVGRAWRDPLRLLPLWSYQRCFSARSRGEKNRTLPDASRARSGFWSPWRSSRCGWALLDVHPARTPLARKT